MTELTLYEGGALDEASDGLLLERLATHYIELQERSNRRIKVADAVRSYEEKHPDAVPHNLVVARAESREFSDYLAKRRKANLVEKVVPSLLAAEAGVKLSAKAAEILLDRMDDPDRLMGMEDRDLVNIYKIASELASKADKAVEAATGQEGKDIQVNVDLRGLLMGLTAEDAQKYIQEATRRLVTGG